MKSNPSLVARFAGLALAVAALGAPEVLPAQIKHQISKAKVTFEMQQTPEYSVAGPRGKKVNPLEWLEIEVELDLETVDPSGYIDALDTEFYIGIRGDNGKNYLLSANMTFVDVRAAEKKAYLCAYVSPAAMARATGKTKPTKNDVDAAAVVIRGNGLRKEVVESTIPVRPGAAPWWSSGNLERREGMVLPKSQTPFAWLWSDRYPLIRPKN